MKEKKVKILKNNLLNTQNLNNKLIPKVFYFFI